MRGRALFFVTLVVAVAGLVSRCHSVPLLAPAGSSISLTANPPFITANGGVSVITALVTRPDGFIVPDGTVVLFFTNLGHVDPEAKTNTGVATVNLVSDSRSGSATVTAFSGGPATQAATTLVASPSPSGSPTPVISPPTGGGGGSSSETTVLIGNVNAAIVRLISDAGDIKQGRPATLTANVFDSAGNPIAGVPVIFSIDQSTTGHPLEGLEDQGTPQFTDTNGQAFDVLFTKQPPTNATATVSVQASTANGVQSNVLVVSIN